MYYYSELRWGLRRSYCAVPKPDLDLGRRIRATQVANFTIFPLPRLPELGETSIGFTNPYKDCISNISPKALWASQGRADLKMQWDFWKGISGLLSALF